MTNWKAKIKYLFLGGSSGSAGRIRASYAGLLAVSVIWGVSFGFAKISLEVFPQMIFTLLRFAFALPFLFAILLWKERSVRITVRDGWLLLLVGFISVAIFENLQVYAIHSTTLANSSLLTVAPLPIFTALLSPLFIKEKITVRLAIGGAFSMIGVSMVIFGGSGSIDFHSQYMTGNLAALGASCVNAVVSLAYIPFMRRYSALRVSTWCMTFGAISLFPFTLGQWTREMWIETDLLHWSSLAYGVIAANVIGLVIWNACMNRVGATRANFFRYLLPATAILTGILVFGEKIVWLEIAGAALMLAGLIAISRDKSVEAAANASDFSI